MDIHALLLADIQGREETRAVRSQGEKNVNCMAMEIHRVGYV